MHKVKQNAKSKRRGTTTVELSLTLPILFLFFFAQIEFARANMVRHSLRTASFEGCRAGIVLGTTEDDVEAAAKQSLVAVGLSQYTVSVTPSVITPSTREVTVRVTAPINENSWIVPLFLDGVVLENSMTMERELTDQLIF
jgi:Flp pilus assembly protein TadG